MIPWSQRNKDEKFFIYWILSIISIYIASIIYYYIKFKGIHLILSICPTLIYFLLSITFSVFLSNEKKHLANKKATDDNLKKYNHLYKIYDKLKLDASVPSDSKEISVTKSNPHLKITEGQYYIWKDNNTLNLFPKIQLYDEFKSTNMIYKLTTIKLNNIEYFTNQGEIFKENKISGGIGSGVSITGAIIGGAIAGDVGAIIGSRKKQTPVKSELITHDNRETIIVILTQNNLLETIFLSFEDFFILKQLIPEKFNSLD